MYVLHALYTPPRGSRFRVHTAVFRVLLGLTVRITRRLHARRACISAPTCTLLRICVCLCIPARLRLVLSWVRPLFRFTHILLLCRFDTAPYALLLYRHAITTAPPPPPFFNRLRFFFTTTTVDSGLPVLLHFYIPVSLHFSDYCAFLPHAHSSVPPLPTVARVPHHLPLVCTGTRSPASTCNCCITHLYLPFPFFPYLTLGVAFYHHFPTTYTPSPHTLPFISSVPSTILSPLPPFHVTPTHISDIPTTYYYPLPQFHIILQAVLTCHHFCRFIVDWFPMGQ